MGTCSTCVKFISCYLILSYLVNSSVLSFGLFTKQTTSYQPVTRANYCDELSVCVAYCAYYLSPMQQTDNNDLCFLYSSSGIDAAIMSLATVYFNNVLPRRPTHCFCKHKDPHQLLCVSFPRNATKLLFIYNNSKAG